MLTKARDRLHCGLSSSEWPEEQKQMLHPWTLTCRYYKILRPEKLSWEMFPKWVRALKMQETFCWDSKYLLVKGAVCLELCAFIFARWAHSVCWTNQTSCYPRRSLETPQKARHIHRLPQLSAGERRTAAWSRVGCPAQRQFTHRVATSLGHHLITEGCQELNNSCKFICLFWMCVVRG